MSVATELDPAVGLPRRARRADAAAPTPPAAVTVLHPPSPRSIAAPVRLTRRGAVVLAAALVVASAALVAVARASTPDAAAGPARPAGITTGARVVVVHAGDTLWSLAGRLWPDRDPRAAVELLMRRNHLGDAQLVPGEVLRTG